MKRRAAVAHRSRSQIGLEPARPVDVTSVTIDTLSFDSTKRSKLSEDKKTTLPSSPPPPSSPPSALSSTSSAGFSFSYSCGDDKETKSELSVFDFGSGFPSSSSPSSSNAKGRKVVKAGLKPAPSDSSPSTSPSFSASPSYPAFNFAGFPSFSPPPFNPGTSFTFSPSFGDTTKPLETENGKKS